MHSLTRAQTCTHACVHVRHVSTPPDTHAQPRAVAQKTRRTHTRNPCGVAQKPINAAVAQLFHHKPPEAREVLEVLRAGGMTAPTKEVVARLPVGLEEPPARCCGCWEYTHALQ